MTEEVTKKKVVKKKSVKAVEKVECIALRKIGLEDEDRTCDIGEEIFLSREAAIKLQDAGAIKVKL